MRISGSASGHPGTFIMWNARVNHVLPEAASGHVWVIIFDNGQVVGVAGDWVGSVSLLMRFRSVEEIMAVSAAAG